MSRLKSCIKLICTRVEDIALMSGNGSLEEGVMAREDGIYTFTEFGSAVWRVEHFCMGDAKN